MHIGEAIATTIGAQELRPDSSLVPSSARPSSPAHAATDTGIVIATATNEAGYTSATDIRTTGIITANQINTKPPNSPVSPCENRRKAYPDNIEGVKWKGNRYEKDALRYHGHTACRLICSSRIQ